ncbi:MAG: hypothetical protein ACKOWN_02720 [Microbacteriaceae bacterium]
MRWDDIFDGLDSLWDAEEANAEWDERREIVRAERAQHAFTELLVRHAGTAMCTVGVDGLASPLHIVTLGANWCEGQLCGNTQTAITPTLRIQWISSVNACDCDLATPRVFEHITLTAKLRGFERAGTDITVSIANGGFRGRVSAVWKDAFDLRSQVRTVTLSLGAVHVISIDRS